MRTNWKLSEREAAALDTEAGRNAYHEAQMNGKSEAECREAALGAWGEAEARGTTSPARTGCAVCGDPTGVRCCEFGADR